MKKRFLAVMAAAVLSVSVLAACGGAGGDKAAAPAQTEEKKEEPKAEEKKEEPKAEEKKEEAKAEDKSAEKPAVAEKNASPTAAAGAAEDAEVVYVDGYYANNGESDMMLAFFEVGDVDVAYATDGEYEFWSQYTVEQATTDDGTEYLLVSFTDVDAQLGYIEGDDGYYLVDEDGNVYAAAQLTEEEANQLYDAVQTGASAENENAVVDTSDITYVDGYYANDGNGNDFIIAFYETPNGDVAYVNDGTDEVLAEYTVEDATTADGVDYSLVTVGNLKMGYVADGEDVLIITEDDEVYAAAPLEESEAEALVAAVQQ